MKFIFETINLFRGPNLSIPPLVTTEEIYKINFEKFLNVIFIDFINL